MRQAEGAGAFDRHFRLRRCLAPRPEEDGAAMASRGQVSVGRMRIGAAGRRQGYGASGPRGHREGVLGLRAL